MRLNRTHTGIITDVLVGALVVLGGAGCADAECTGGLAYVSMVCWGQGRAVSAELDDTDSGIEWETHFEYRCSAKLDFFKDDVACYDPLIPVDEWHYKSWSTDWDFSGQIPGSDGYELVISVGSGVQADILGAPAAGVALSYPDDAGINLGGKVHMHGAGFDIELEYTVTAAEMVPIEVTAGRYEFDLTSLTMVLSEDNDPAALESFGEVLAVPQTLTLKGLGGSCETRLVEEPIC